MDEEQEWTLVYYVLYMYRQDRHAQTFAINLCAEITFAKSLYSTDKWTFLIKYQFSLPWLILVDGCNTFL